MNFVVVVVLVVVVVVVVGSDNVINSMDSNCCDACNNWTKCKGTIGLEIPSVNCSYKLYKKTDVESTIPIKSCGKPDNLQVTVEYVNDEQYFHLSWSFPKDLTIQKVTGFLIVTSYESTDESDSEGEIVTLFNVSGVQNLNNDDLEKLSNVQFDYDCIRVRSNTTYMVKVRTLPSSENGATESLDLETFFTPRNNIDERCNQHWVAFMFVKFVIPQISVCFRSAPSILKMNRYVLHVMTKSQYSSNTRNAENLEEILLNRPDKFGANICRNFTLKEPGNYVAVLQPVYCICNGDDVPCDHTFIEFVMPTVTKQVNEISTISSLAKMSGTSPQALDPKNIIIGVFVSTFVVVGVILLLIYCCVNDMKDYIMRLIFNIIQTRDTKVLIVFQPSKKATNIKAVKSFIYHLKWKSRALIETIPELEKPTKRLLREKICDYFNSKVKDLSSTPKSMSCNCICCNIDNDINRLNIELNQYNKLIILHTNESSEILKIFKNTKDIPDKVCCAFTKVANIYCQKPSNPESRLRKTPEIIRAIEKIESGYYSGVPSDLLSQSENLQDENMNCYEVGFEVQENIHQHNQQNDTISEIVDGKDDSISLGSSSTICICRLPKIIHVKFQADFDISLIISLFGSAVHDVDKNLSEIVNLIIETPSPGIYGPSPVSEV